MPIMEPCVTCASDDYEHRGDKVNYDRQHMAASIASVCAQAAPATQARFLVVRGCPEGRGGGTHGSGKSTDGRYPRSHILRACVHVAAGRDVKADTRNPL